MKKNILFSTLCILLAGCTGPESTKSEASAGSPYRTTAPSLLYFKNIRSTYYEQSEQPGARIELYRLRQFSQPAKEHVLIPVIANNWLEDEAFIFLEPVDFGQPWAQPLTVRWQGEKDSGLYRLQPANVDKQYELALQLYESLLAGHQLNALAADSTWAPLMESKNTRGYYLTTIRDYLRLTEAL
ncbi:MAG: hypothetical protein H6573_21290 [Lewinellaceae bacterium]|nr:hypothetical protein [Phaeodactylibacter sp.]MCB0612635.1 hypothetical protein [Phaeodactylibacter sp.]MCB9350020.1 hypothetical protein [Lewinellaceae bacterium]